MSNKNNLHISYKDSLNIKESVFIHKFCTVLKVFNGFIYVKSLCSADKRKSRYFFMKKGVYNKDGIIVGFIIDYFKRRHFVIKLSSNIKVKVGDILHIYDTSYKWDYNIICLLGFDPSYNLRLNLRYRFKSRILHKDFCILKEHRLENLNILDKVKIK